MSDQLDALLAEVRGAQPPTAFAPAEQVRRRGRQRTRRTALAAGAGVLAVTTVAAVLGAGLAQPRPDRFAPPPADSTPTTTAPATVSPTPSRTSPPTPTRKAGGVLLQPDELGPGTWRRFEAEQFQNADRWYWGLWDGACPAYRSSLFPSLPHRKALETTAYRSGAASSVFQIVERYDTGWGDDNVDDVRTAIDRCGDAQPTAETLAVPHFAVVETGFAGDESLLVREETVLFGPGPTSDPEVRYIAVVRVGDAVTTIRVYPSDADRLRSLAERAAARLG